MLLLLLATTVDAHATMVNVKSIFMIVTVVVVIYLFLCLLYRLDLCAVNGCIWMYVVFVVAAEVGSSKE